MSYYGVGDYWEDVDQYIRNHGIEMQLTPEDISWLQNRIKGKSAAPKHPSEIHEDVILGNMGSYANHVPPYKSSTSLCCSPHGNMGLFYAWDGILRHNDGVIRVNLLLNRASPWMDVDSYLPFEGKVVLKNKTAREVFVRIPLWVKKENVNVSCNGSVQKNRWLDQYVRISNLKPSDVITINFPVEQRVEEWTKPNHGPFLIGAIPGGTKFKIRFRGNTVVNITPNLMSDDSPLYRNRPEKYKADKAPMKKVKRYMTPAVLKW